MVPKIALRFACPHADYSSLTRHSRQSCAQPLGATWRNVPPLGFMERSEGDFSGLAAPSPRTRGRARPGRSLRATPLAIVGNSRQQDAHGIGDGPPDFVQYCDGVLLLDRFDADLHQGGCSHRRRSCLVKWRIRGKRSEAITCFGTKNGGFLVRALTA
jgi:hypothetical protein